MPRSFALVTLVAGITLIASGCGSGGKTQAPKKKFTRANYSVLFSDPDSYKGSSVRFVGKVFQIERDEDGTYLQVWADPKSSEWNTAVAVADPSLEVAEDDYVRVVGTVKGALKGKNAFGAELTLPTVVADSVTKTDALAAASPAESTLGRSTWSQSGIAITINKVEFASDETRVFVTVVNHSGASFSFYGSSMKAISGGRQVDSDFSLEEYPEFASDIESGARSSGVVTFPTLDSSRALKLVCEGYSDDMNIGDYGSIKTTFQWPA
jgi:hypothetical protein